MRTGDEVFEITEYVQEEAGYGTDLIWGNCYDETLGEKIGIKRPLKIVEKNKNVKGRRKQNEVKGEIHFIARSIEKTELIVFETETISASVYNNFKENGIFDAKTGESFAENILSKGGTEHPMILYKRFSGKEPNSDALLKRAGLV